MLLEELSDHLFEDTKSALIELGSAIEKELGRKPTFEEFCSLLVEVMDASDLFSDVSPCSLAALKPVLRKVTKRLSRGVLIAVPSKAGGFFVIVHLGFYEGPFGDVFGVLKGKVQRIGKKWEPVSIGRWFGLTLHAIREGRWRVIGHRPEVADLFPKEPYTYHAKKYNQDNPAIGEFGSAETPDRVLRSITKEEAESVGLLTGEYSYAMLEDGFVAFLERYASK